MIKLNTNPCHLRNAINVLQSNSSLPNIAFLIYKPPVSIKQRI